MNTAAINPKGPRPVKPGAGANAWAETYLGSTVGQKILLSVSGVLLVGFVFFHMIGNLKLFHGPDSINKYAEFLKHDLGVLIWIARAGLLALFVMHLMLAIRLKLRSVAARPIDYVKQRSAQATPQSKTMIWTGLVILAFVVFHLAHFTFAWVHDAETLTGRVNYLSMVDSHGRHHVYNMMIAGFSTPWIASLYLVAQVLLFIHLAHGIQSVCQTLGLVGRRFTPAARIMGYAISGIIMLGNLAIVLAVWSGYLTYAPGFAPR